MSVVGFDVGNANCFVSVARAGGIETVANEYSDRCTPAIVAFNSLQRLVGISAKNQMVMNFRSTITQFKRLIGRKFDEPAVQEELKRQPFEVVRTDNGDIGIQVQYRGGTKTFLPEQIMATLLTELKHTAQANLQAKVTDCVISVPSFYTDYQRRALLWSANIAGLNCLKLMNDTSAVALNYGLFKQDLPAPEEKPRHVAFVDMGHASYQVCIAAFNKGKIIVLSMSSDCNLGGRNFDDCLKNYFAEAFLTKYKVDAKSNKKAWLRLGTEVEKIKKQMSSNSTDLPLNIECFMEDKDVSHKVNRFQFEEMCQDLIDRVRQPLVKAVEESGLKTEEIDVVELVGGSTRMPSVKAIVESVFDKTASTTLNLDEAVGRGCAIQCAMLSHTVKVRDIAVLDAATYPINICWDSAKPDEHPGEMEVFKKHHSYPFTKLLTFPHRVEPFRFRAYYKDDVQILHFEKEIGEFMVNAAAPTESSEKVKVKVKVRLDINGCFTVSSASQVETLPPPPEQPKEELIETQNLVNGEVKPTSENPEETNQQAEMDAAQKTTNEEEPQNAEEKKEDNKEEKKDQKKDEKKDEVKKPEAKKQKKASQTTELSVIKSQAGPTNTELNLLIEIENDLISQVRLERERADANNAVEEYVYEMRNKVNEIYQDYISGTDREQFSSLLNQTEDWLYDEGEDEKKQVYVDKLAELKKIGQPIVDRYKAHEELPSAFESFGKAVTHFRKILDLYSNKDEKYAHIEEGEMKKVSQRVDEKLKWFNDKMLENEKCPRHANPAVYPKQVLTEKKLLQDFCNPIVNKPKPKVEPPKDEGKKEDTEPAKETSEPANGASEPTKEAATSEKMETDQKENSEATNEDNLNMEID